MAEHYSNSPPPKQPFRLGLLHDFLPLSEDSLSTRGQKLPALIQSRSTANLGELPGQLHKRRRSTPKRHGDDDVPEDTDSHNGEERNRSPARSTNSGLKRSNTAVEVLMTPQMRSMRLIGNSNPRYQWEKYYKSEKELKDMKKPIRKYYERNNLLISQYLYIDRLLDSSLPHTLIQEYNNSANYGVHIPETIEEIQSPADGTGSSTPTTEQTITNGTGSLTPTTDKTIANDHTTRSKVKRTPKALYHVPMEDSPLLGESHEDGPKVRDIEAGEDEGVDSSSPIVTVAIYINIAANTVLLAGKIVVIVLTNSLSVLASLVDAALDFLSTVIIWTTSRLIARQDRYAYPIGRRRLEPIGVLVFSIIMMTSFFQVTIECLNRLTSGDHSVVHLGIPAIAIMASTVLIKFGCWLWCRFIKNSSVQALAQDAMTDVIFNTFSIIFPLIGFYAQVWWLDALGGLFLSLYVIINWALTSASHIRNLSGRASSADERNILLYLTMRFAKTIKQIQGLQAYHAGDKLNVEVDVVLDENMHLRDSHDLGESLQYVLESVPYVDRAFVHLDYDASNLPTHMQQQDD